MLKWLTCSLTRDQNNVNLPNYNIFKNPSKYIFHLIRLSITSSEVLTSKLKPKLKDDGQVDRKNLMIVLVVGIKIKKFSTFFFERKSANPCDLKREKLLIIKLTLLVILLNTWLNLLDSKEEWVRVVDDKPSQLLYASQSTFLLVILYIKNHMFMKTYYLSQNSEKRRRRKGLGLVVCENK